MAEPTPSLSPAAPTPAPQSPIVRNTSGPTPGLRTRAIADAVGLQLEGKIREHIRAAFKEVGLEPNAGPTRKASEHIGDGAAKSLRYELAHGLFNPFGLFGDDAPNGNRGASEGGASGGSGATGG